MQVAHAAIRPPEDRTPDELKLMAHVITMLSSRSFFFGTDENMSRLLCESAYYRCVEHAGQVVCLQGDEGNSFMMILHGCALPSQPRSPIPQPYLSPCLRLNPQLRLHLEPYQPELSWALSPDPCRSSVSIHVKGATSIDVRLDQRVSVGKNRDFSSSQRASIESRLGPSVDTLGVGESFGELSLLRNFRTASVVARQDRTEFLVITRQAFDKVISAAGVRTEAPGRCRVCVGILGHLCGRARHVGMG